MAAKTLGAPQRTNSKTVAGMIREAVENNGHKDVKEFVRGLKGSAIAAGNAKGVADDPDSSASRNFSTWRTPSPASAQSVGII